MFCAGQVSVPRIRFDEPKGNELFIDEIRKAGLTVRVFFKDIEIEQRWLVFADAEAGYIERLVPGYCPIQGQLPARKMFGKVVIAVAGPIPSRCAA
ncbi:MAG TPA: hypothetical protein VKT73_12970 [Xanthobacteraceae bacterium]|nr:hypothetical protein [Xanthobacteraceae bacterium]